MAMVENQTELETNKPVAQTPEPVPSLEPAFGWTSYAELINGRFAMIGFLALILLELFTHQSFFQWLFG